MKAFLSLCLCVAAAVCNGCTTKTHHDTSDAHTRTYVKITAFHLFPQNPIGRTFRVIPLQETDNLALETVTYVDYLSQKLVERGMIQGSLSNIYSNDYIFFLRFRPNNTRSTTIPGLGLMNLKGCSVRIEVEPAIAVAAQLEGAHICEATINVDTYGDFSLALGVPCALRQFASAFPFVGQNPYTREQQFGELASDYP